MALLKWQLLPSVLLSLSPIYSAHADDEFDDDALGAPSERIVISAYRDPFLTETPDTITAVSLELSDAETNVSSVLDILDMTPGVFANGQGGMFQTYSIRGSAKNRIRTLVEGIPIVTERRAGVSSSFIDPLMFQSIDVMRGPVSTFYGSGALGGAINFFLKSNNTSSMTLGAQDQGSGRYGSYIYASDDLKLGLSYRDVGNTEAANGDELNNAFSSTNLLLRKTWQDDELNYDFFWLETDARDIGKSNARFNVSRNTFYPKETHSLVKFQARHNSGWQANIFYHPNDLITDNDNLSGNLIRSENSSDDLGVTFQKETDFFDSMTDNIDAQWGIDWFARRDVTAFEVEFDRTSQAPSRSEVIQDGSLDDLAVFMSAIITQSDSNWHLGWRYNHQNSSVANSSSVSESATTGFVGFSTALSEQFKLQLNAATGFRFPTLSERFFSGTTARGDLIAPINLDKETSVNFDAALMWLSGPQSIQLNAFHMDVDNYIERVRLDSGERTFVNLNNGVIEGAELVYRYTLEQHIVELSYTSYEGKADNGDYLADIPTDELSLSYLFTSDKWQFDFNWQFRQDKDNLGSGEISSDAYDVLDLGFDYQLNLQWSVSVTLDNALDELYLPSNDDLDTFASGRTLGLAIHWHGN